MIGTSHGGDMNMAHGIVGRATGKNPMATKRLNVGKLLRCLHDQAQWSGYQPKNYQALRSILQRCLTQRSGTLQIRSCPSKWILHPLLRPSRIVTTSQKRERLRLHRLHPWSMKQKFSKRPKSTSRLRCQGWNWKNTQARRTQRRTRSHQLRRQRRNPK